jgi:hypothetical protein
MTSHIGGANPKIGGANLTTFQNIFNSAEVQLTFHFSVTILSNYFDKYEFNKCIVA